MEKLLEDIGLTEGETKVYLGLLKLGSTKVGALIAESGVSASKIYTLLEKLERKGLVGHSIIEKTKHFKAMSPSSIVDYMKENEKKMKEKRELVQKMIPEMASLSEKQVKSEVFVYQGFKAVKNFLYNMLDDVDDSYIVLGARYEENIFGVRAFFKDFHAKRAKKGVKVKMLANYEAKGNMEPETRKLGEVRFLPEYLITNMHVFIYGSNVFMIMWAKEPIAVYMNNKDVSISFRSYFDAFWKIGEK